MGLDPAAISHWQQRVALLQAATVQLDRDLRLLHQRQTALSKQTRTLTGDALHGLLVESNQTASETQITRLIKSSKFGSPHSCRSRADRGGVLFWPLIHTRRLRFVMLDARV